jgi:hypothetical protein
MPKVIQKIPSIYNGLVSSFAKSTTMSFFMHRYDRQNNNSSGGGATGGGDTGGGNTDDSIDVYTPYTFSEILQTSVTSYISLPTSSASTLTNRSRYLLKTNDTYIQISDNYEIEFSNTFITYNDYLTKIFQLVQDSTDSTSYRIDSELNYLYSLDYDTTNSKLIFKNNWGNGGSYDLPSGIGYLCFNYTTDYKLQVTKRYSYDTTEYTHTEDTTILYNNYYVQYDTTNSKLILTLESTDASTFTIYDSPIDVSIPTDFNPIPTAYVSNDRVSIKDYISNIRTNIEGNTPEDPDCKFLINFYSTDGSEKLVSDAGYTYANQLTTAGYDNSTNGTNYYANLMLNEISSKVSTNTTYKSLRYDTSVYKTFREGALKVILKGDDIANGDVGMNTTPYVYFTCEKDDSSGEYHPFMCMASYSISDNPNRLLDVCRPPGDGGDGGHVNNDVTRDATLQLNLTKIPMLNYGTVSDISGSVSYSSSTGVTEINSNTNDLYTASLAYDFINYYTDNGNDSMGSRIITSIDYDNYNYAPISGIGIIVDGVSLYPVLNNTLVTAHKSAEITNTGIHVGQGMGLHYHGDGYGAKLTFGNNTNNLFLYNDNDYIDTKHPPLIGFGLDGIALYGIYNSNHSSMHGYNVELDNFGGHTHGNYGYHYHCHTIQNNASNNIDTITDGSDATTYKIHALMKGAWKGNVNNIPEFWDTSHGSNNQYAPEYSLSQKNKYVWGYTRA